MKRYLLFVALAGMLIAGCSGGAIEQEGKHEGTVFKQWGKDKVAKTYDSKGNITSEVPYPEMEYSGPGDWFKRSMFDYRIMSPFGMGGPESVVSLKDISMTPSAEPVMSFGKDSVTPVTVTDKKGNQSVATVDGGQITQKGGTSWMYQVRQIIVGLAALVLLVAAVPFVKKLVVPLLSKIPYVGSLFATSTVVDTATKTVAGTVDGTVIDNTKTATEVVGETK